jgi:hypothetical protein
MTPDQPPELVFVPARPQVSGGGREVAYETRTLADGTVALPVYSTVTRLVAALGHYQPWMCLPLRTVQADMGNAGVHQVVVDAKVDTSAWRWQEGSLRILANGQGRRELASRSGSGSLLAGPAPVDARQQAPVDHHADAGEVAGLVGGQEDGDVSHVARRGEPVQRQRSMISCVPR